ncbi:MAG TPA: DUF885 domain-containing protein [Vicinamibacteria bacterium]|nr:DUF885 domain-containing protein [Vicinamibacteria bacterium]
MPFREWLDRFFDSYYQSHPVNATFIGHHEHDHRLPEFSDVDAASLLAELASLPAEELTPVEEIDRELARGHLEIESWELASGRLHELNPACYTGEAIFGVFSLLLRDFAPREERYRNAAERLAAIPNFLEQGKTNLRRAPRTWTERALRECEGAIDFFDHGLPRLEGSTLLATPGAEARQAFVSFREHLESEVEEAPTGAHASGEEAFDLLLRKAHFLEESASEIAARARESLRRTESELDSGAPKFGSSDYREVLARLEDIRAPREESYQRCRELWEESRAFAIDRGLVTWPDYPLDFVPQPAWAREAAPKLYFLFYRSPAPLDALPRVDHLVPLADSGIAEAVIKLNHVVHHAGLGHHVQNWHASRAQSRIGRVAAVDCAYRIAMLCGGTMAEGWASYATDLMDEAGFLTPLESFAEHHAHARAAARAVVDVELHRGRMSLDEAESFYRVHTNMSETAARSEVTKNGMFPGAALIYFVGSHLIREIRREHEGRLGLRGFHDRFLSHGSIPVAITGRAMRLPLAPRSIGSNAT